MRLLSPSARLVWRTDLALLQLSDFQDLPIKFLAGVLLSQPGWQNCRFSNLLPTFISSDAGLSFCLLQFRYIPFCGYTSGFHAIHTLLTLSLSVTELGGTGCSPRWKDCKILLLLLKVVAFFFMNIWFSICCLPLANHRTTTKLILFCFLCVQFYICFLGKIFASLFMPPQTEIPIPISDFWEFFIHSGS